MAQLRRNDQHPGPLGPALRTLDTPRGPARVDLDDATAGLCLLVLGHGAGGDVDAPDLVAVRDAARDAGAVVARVTQPYRVAGRRAPAPAGHLDEAWTAVVRELTAEFTLPLVLGGRSSGARVACRTAPQLGAVAVLALAFPEHPPGKPERSRGAELRTGVPTLVINGESDPFGRPEPSDTVEVRVVPGDHGLKRDPAAVARLAVDWLAARLTR
jgi:predicted alpha/beta-hydrolase family hydrolase